MSRVSQRWVSRYDSLRVIVVDVAQGAESAGLGL